MSVCSPGSEFCVCCRLTALHILTDWWLCERIWFFTDFCLLSSLSLSLSLIHLLFCYNSCCYCYYYYCGAMRACACERCVCVSYTKKKKNRTWKTNRATFKDRVHMRSVKNKIIKYNLNEAQRCCYGSALPVCSCALFRLAAPLPH